MTKSDLAQELEMTLFSRTQLRREVTLFYPHNMILYYKLENTIGLKIIVRLC